MPMRQLKAEQGLSHWLEVVKLRRNGVVVCPLMTDLEDLAQVAGRFLDESLRWALWVMAPVVAAHKAFLVPFEVLLAILSPQQESHGLTPRLGGAASGSSGPLGTPLALAI